MERVSVPKLDLQTQEIEIIKWHKSEGDRVKKDEPLLEISTEKATVEIEAPMSGVLGGIAHQAGEKVKIGDTLAYVYLENEQGPAPVTTVTAANPAPIRSTPAARKLCKENSVKIEEVFQAVGIEPIGEREVKQFLASKRQPSRQDEQYETVELSSRRKIIARRMQESVRTIPHIHLFGEANVGRLEVLQAELSKGGTRITLTDLILRILGTALSEFPLFNAVAVDDGVGLVVRKYRKVNIGLAVSSDHGLVVPVLKDVTSKTMAELVREKQELISKARANKLSPDDLSEGTFTLSNLGMHDVTSFTAIINPPEVAILTVGASRDRLELVDGKLVTVRVVGLCLGLDHRVLDGTDGGRFLSRLKQLLEEPPNTRWNGELRPSNEG
jgi:pyruvate dehydrogenase E2 component (dihydrolipoamide acetyltransferase)